MVKLSRWRQFNCFFFLPNEAQVVDNGCHCVIDFGTLFFVFPLICLLLISVCGADAFKEYNWRCIWIVLVKMRFIFVASYIVLSIKNES